MDDLDIHDVMRAWLSEGRRVVAATLVEALGSAPLEPGAMMLVDDRGNIEGSVTGGCVEGALVEEAREVLAGGSDRIRRYGISDADAVDVGLMCGGTVQLFVHELREPSRPALLAAAEAMEEGHPVAIATVIEGDSAGAKLVVLDDRVVGELGLGERFDAMVERDARGLLAQGVSTVRRYGSGGTALGTGLSVHVQSFASPPHMVIFGATDFSVAVAVIARELGYRVTVCDARAAFARSARLARVAEVVVEWPDSYLEGRALDERDVVLVFSHDPKFDEPALRSALQTDAGYIGALGSRRTQEQRLGRLREAGLDEEAVGRISAPCGLDLGARTPTETAISVLAEVIARRSGRSGRPLSKTAGPIHDRSGAPVAS